MRVWNRLRVLAALLVAAPFVASAAFAATATIQTSGAPLVVSDTAVAIPWGNWLSIGLTSLWGLVGTSVVAFIASSLRGPLRWFVTTQMLTSITDSVVAQTAGAVAGRQLSVAVVNSILRQATQLFVDNEPKLASWMGDMTKPFVLGLLQRRGMVPNEAHGPHGANTADDHAPEHALDMAPPGA